jgi:hypothetical protein
MIASVLTHDYAVQVSDRRLTRLPDFQVVSEQTPKTIVTYGCLLFGYTGIAVIGNPPEPTHRVITEILSRGPRSAPPDQQVAWITKEIETRVTKRSFRRGRGDVYAARPF